MDYIKVYVDDKEISSGHTLSSPISAFLDSSKKEEKAIKCKAVAVKGYSTIGQTMLYFSVYNNGKYETTGAALDKFKIAPDVNFASAEDAKTNATWATSISTEVVISDTVPYYFWVKMASDNTEEPVTDTSVALSVKYTAQAGGAA